ncbi:MAG: tRNA 2-thiouridine(34) synthase MnmA [Planctomycetes bacterium]|nr:tRNA 2-thiouridine(34) synthase MnmA [Planctomycetota bacterium]
MTRVLLAMSGGVDSSACAVLLQQAGHEVVGVFMRNGVAGAEAEKAKSCCSASDARDAAAVADRLGIAFYSVDYATEFAGLIEHFAAEYRRGRTPNPCVLCNQQLKFGHLFTLARSVGAERVATGHYARVADGRLHRAEDRAKDQSYYLFGIDRAVLDKVVFPIGALSKDEVRERAAAAGLRTAHKPESMDICFVTAGDYRDVVRQRGGAGRPGVIVDGSGHEVGRHDGVDGFTVGQRRGLPALGAPHYVRRIDPTTGVVEVCRKDGLLADTAAVRGVNWLIDPPREPIAAEVQIRARSAAEPAWLEPGEGQTVTVRFDAPVSAVTPGQAAVFYRGDQVLGGGWLD